MFWVIKGVKGGEKGVIYLKTINKSLDQGMFAEEWKVLPEKRRNTSKADEYCPISTLPCHGKLLELVL